MLLFAILCQALSISTDNRSAIRKVREPTRTLIDLGNDKCVRIPLWEAMEIWLVQTSLATVEKSFSIVVSSLLAD